MKHEIHNRILTMKSHIFDNFSNQEQVIEKSITKSEFDEKYGVGYETFSEAGLVKFQSAVNDKIEKGELLDEEIEATNAQLTTLSKVLVKGEDNKLINLYVRKK